MKIPMLLVHGFLGFLPLLYIALSFLIEFAPFGGEFWAVFTVVTLAFYKDQISAKTWSEYIAITIALTAISYLLADDVGVFCIAATVVFGFFADKCYDETYWRDLLGLKR